MQFDKLTKYLDSLSEVGIPGSDCVIWQGHRPIYRHTTGWSDRENKIPMNGNEVYWMFSATKVMTCTCAMQLIMDGKLGLDDPVAKYLPAYTLLTVNAGDMTRAAKTPMTIRHLMSMQSGLDYELETKSIFLALETYGRNVTTKQLVDAIAHKPLQFDPGEDYLYGLSHDVLGAVIEAASGQTLGEYMRQHIFVPLGMKTASFELTKEHYDRLCAQYRYNAESGKMELIAKDDNVFHLYSDKYESGGGGLLCDVADYILFADAMANDGIGKNGAQILSKEGIDLLRTPQLEGKSKATFDMLKRKGYNYALGVRVMVEDIGHGSIGEFGWDGAAGAYVLIDPKEHLAIFYAEHVQNFGYNYDVIHPTIRNLAYEVLMGR